MLTKHRTGYLFKRKNNFYLRYTVEGKIISKALRDENGLPITKKREAEEARAKIMAAFHVADETEALESVAAKIGGRKAELARFEEELNPPMLLKQAWAEFLKAPNRPDTGKSTLRQYEFQFGALTNWLEETHPGLLTMRDVTKQIAEEYATFLLSDRKLSPSTYNKHLNLLTLVFRVLKDKAKIAGNPWVDLQRKRHTPQGRRELTVKELRDVCQCATGELRILLALGVYTGLRLGDCATLRWAETDLDRGFIRRVPNKTARRNPKPVIAPITDTLMAILKELKPTPKQQYVLPKIADLYLNRIDTVTDLVQGHFKDCGLTVNKPGTGTGKKRAVTEVGFHSLRHTFVSLCREKNVPLAVVESIVGHSNPAMTRHYTHVGELAAEQAVAALPNVVDDAEPQKDAQTQGNLLDQIRDRVKGMTTKNWKKRKAEILALIQIIPEV